MYEETLLTLRDEFVSPSFKPMQKSYANYGAELFNEFVILDVLDK